MLSFFFGNAAKGHIFFDFFLKTPNFCCWLGMFQLATGLYTPKCQEKTIISAVGVKLNQRCWYASFIS